MNTERLLNDVLAYYFMEYGADTVKDIAELPKMLKDINDHEIKKGCIGKVTACELLDLNNSVVEEYTVSGGEIHIRFGFTYAIQALDFSSAMLAVQGSARLEFSIPDTGAFDWSAFEKSGWTFKESYKQFKSMLKLKNAEYTDVVCEKL